MKIRALGKLRSLSTTVKATIVFGLASFAINGMNYITTPIFTRLLSSADFGIIAVYNSWLQIAQIFASLTLVYPGMLNVGLYEHSDNRWKYLSSIAGVISCSTGVLFALYLVFNNQVSAMTGVSSSLLLLMLLACLTNSSTTLWTTKQRYEYNYKITAIVTIGTAIIAQVVSIVAVLLLRGHTDISLAEVRLWSAGIVNVAVGFVLYFYIIKQGKRFVDTALWKSTIILAIPLIPHYLSWVVLQGTDKIMISRMVGADKTGIYSLATTLSSIGILFWRALSSTFAPFINSKLGERKFKDINEVLKHLLALVCLTCLIGAFAAPEIIRILATEEYLEGVYAIPPVVIGIYLHVLYEVLSSVAFFHKKPIRIMMPSIIAAVLNLALNYHFILKFGYIAAGYTTMTANLALIVMHYYNVIKIENDKVFDSKFIVITMAILSVLCLTCNFLYSYYIVRYIAIAIILVVMFRMRRSVVRAINNMKV